ncbi:MAG: DUF3426 domain-containing protein [Gammaproteobacteria bacterium]|jgi:predicted Zn finger-like uncharacterized protein|nr:DUF3426 domain-containing protein [Gammaproteobacteria bacterium]
MTDESLEPLITQCAHCGSSFRVTDVQLRAAAGTVRCGECEVVFDGTQRLSIDGEPVGCPGSGSDGVDEVDAILAELSKVPTEPAVEPALDKAELAVVEHAALLGEDEDKRDLPAELLVLEAALLSDIRTNEATSEAAVENVLEQSKFESRNSQRSGLGSQGSGLSLQRVRFAYVALLVLLVVGLPVQILWFKYDQWVNDSELRPLYAAICPLTGCQLPPQHDVQRIVSQRTVIRPHPQFENAKIVDVLLLNNADFAQPFPRIEVMAFTLLGKPVAERQFLPSEYLSAGQQRPAFLAAKTPTHVSLEILNPSEDALNFRLNFR